MDIKSKNIIEGFKDDFDLIVNLFREENQNDGFKNYRLVSFFELWNKKFVDCIFVNRFDPRELLEAISNMNQCLVSILCQNDQNDLGRLVSLYFLLCLYVKQPARLRRKIRLTCDEATVIQSLYSNLKQSGYESDAEFAWNYLKNLEAIDIVEESVVYGPSMLSNRASRKHQIVHCESVGEGCNDTKEFIQNRIEPILSELNSYYTPYNQIKGTLKLDEYRDSTVEIQNNENLGDLLDQARNTLYEFQTQQED